jgi:hypothetical protein
MVVVKKVRAQKTEAEQQKDDLLERWLSVAESQICSLEVLSAQIPRARSILEENVEGLGGEFAELAHQAKVQGQLVQRFDDRIGELPADDVLAATVAEMKQSMEIMNRHVMAAVVGMQFQDRVSQNMVIAENVVNENVLHLRENIEETLPFFVGGSHSASEGRFTAIDIDFAKRLMGLLTLGELQHQFVNNLLTHSYIEDSSMLLDGAAASEASDDLELF